MEAHPGPARAPNPARPPPPSPARTAKAAPILNRAPAERLAIAHVTPYPWGGGRRDVTTLKIKRNVVYERYAARFRGLYEG